MCHALWGARPRDPFQFAMFTGGSEPMPLRNQVGRNLSPRSRCGLTASWQPEMLEARTLLSSITGFVHQDTNGNGAVDAGETKIQGRTVFTDFNSNAVPDPGEPSAVTAADGSYTLANLSATKY